MGFSLSVIWSCADDERDSFKLWLVRRSDGQSALVSGNNNIGHDGGNSPLLPAFFNPSGQVECSTNEAGTDPQRQAKAMTDDHSGMLLARWRQGDQQAASELFRRYADRLVALAKSRLSRKMAQRVDPEDVVQSVYRTFFADSREGRYELERGGDLWQLLVTITLHKLQHQVTHASARKRAVERDRNFGSEDSLFGIQADVLAQNPSPVEAVALSELLELVMRQLDPRERRMLELRLQGCNLEEIARQTQLSRRTVRRTLKEVKERLERWHTQDSSS
jgi:RNA polymerase sigma-70 factor (ECF subfamily)